MLVHSIDLLFLLIAIVLASLLFSNAVESLGEKLNLGHHVTGSILAAVGTALPETVVPLVAIFLASQMQSADGGVHAKHGIAIGSIIGAPFLLGTLALFLIGLTMLLHRKKRKTTDLLVNPAHLRRDLYYFLIAFSLAMLASFVPHLSTQLATTFKIAIVILLGLLYAIYLIKTLEAHDESADVNSNDVDPYEETPHQLYFSNKWIRLPNTLPIVILQIVLGLIGIIFFAEKFVHALETMSDLIGVNPLVLSLIITPIATELPEKVNSCVWVSQRKDALAIGNITGAMVFQSSIPCAIGILFTPWQLDLTTSLCGALAIAGALLILVSLYFFKKITAWVLLVGGVFYLIYLLVIFRMFSPGVF